MEDPIKVILIEKNKDRDKMIEMTKKIVKLENKISRMRSGSKKQAADFKKEKDNLEESYMKKINELEDSLKKKDVEWKKKMTDTEIENIKLREDIDIIFRVLKRGGNLKEVNAMLERDCYE